ncbi:murein biosynthesis integral membrane protein MurJ [Patescibacteria group bacterium]|nr:murein biosynthesis integral membrane protein MurJ [Patescibacteria group bacterium]
MIKGVFNFLDKDISGLHKAAYVLGFSAFLSQLLALLRDRILAHSFGAGEVLDIYYSAFRIPDFIFITVASIVSVSVLIPFLSQERNEEKAKKFMNEVFSTFFLLILIISAITFLFIPKIIPFIFRGFSADVLEQVILLTKIMLMSPILLGLSNFFTSIIQTQKKFFVYALSPLLYNIGIIIGILWYYPLWGISGLALGVVTGAFLHLIIQLPSIYNSGFIPKFTLKIYKNRIKSLMVLSLPRTLAVSASSLAILVLISIATYMREGSIAIFNFSYALQSVPLTIIGVSYTTAAFPMLSQISKEKRVEFMEQISITTRHILFWTIPALVLFFILRAQIVRTVLGSGEFTWVDTRLTAACLAIFALSIPAQSLILFFVRGYYAAGITKRPVLINVFSSIFIIVLVFLFKWIFASVPILLTLFGYLLKIQDISDIQVIILPLSFTIATLLNMCMLFFFIQKDFHYSLKDSSKTFFQIFFTSILMGVVAYFSLKIWDNVFDINTLVGIFLQGLFSGLGGIIVWAITLKLLDNEEINTITYTIRKRLSK